MPSLSSFTDPKTYHILTYGTLLGSTFFQTFIGGPVAFKALPRPSFSTLQTAIFPVYFALGSVLPLVLAYTWPGTRVGMGVGMGMGESVLRRDAGVAGLMQGENVRRALVPIALNFFTAVLNLGVLGPATTRVMKERKHQETRDGKKYYDPGPKSSEMERLNKSFMWMHSASSLANMIGFGALLYYSAVLSEQL